MQVSVKIWTIGALVAAVAAVGGLLVSCGDDEDPAAATDASALAEPITVQQLVERSADTPITVTGFLYADGTTVRLCNAVLESYPPQCGSAAVELAGLDMSTVDGTTSEGEITWRESTVLEVQHNLDGTFTVLDVIA